MKLRRQGGPSPGLPHPRPHRLETETLPDPVLRDRALCVMVSASHPEAVCTPGETRGQAHVVLPSTFLFFSSEVGPWSLLEEKPLPGIQWPQPAVGDAAERCFSSQQRRWPASPTQTHRPQALFPAVGAHTAKPDSRNLSCAEETLPLPSGPVFSASC